MPASAAACWYAPEAIVPTVPIAPTRPDARRRGRGADAGFDDADDRDLVAVLQRVERDRGRAVARDDEHLDAAVDEQVGDLERVLQHVVGRLRTVREAAGVAEVERRLVRQQVDERAQHREPAEPGVEDADRPFVDRGLRLHPHRPSR